MRTHVRHRGRERKVERLELARLGIEHGEGVHRLVDHGAREAPVREEAVRAHAEDPHRIAQLDLEVRQLLAVAVQVPPTASVGDPVQRAVRAPLGLEDRLVGAAGDPLVLDPELAAEKRQQRVVPGEIREPSVGAESRRAVEVAPCAQHARLARAVCGKRDELVHDVAAAVGLAHADHRRAVRRDAAVGVAERVRFGWFGRHRTRIAARRRRGTRGCRRSSRRRTRRRAAMPRRRRTRERVCARRTRAASARVATRPACAARARRVRPRPGAARSRESRPSSKSTTTQPNHGSPLPRRLLDRDRRSATSRTVRLASAPSYY